MLNVDRMRTALLDKDLVLVSSQYYFSQKQSSPSLAGRGGLGVSPPAQRVSAPSQETNRPLRQHKYSTDVLICQLWHRRGILAVGW